MTRIKVTVGFLFRLSRYIKEIKYLKKRKMVLLILLLNYFKPTNSFGGSGLITGKVLPFGKSRRSSKYPVNSIV